MQIKRELFHSIMSSKNTVWLFTKNIKTERSFRKLNHKWIKSYKIKKILKEACQLDLLSSMKIHDTFHISLLRSAATDSFIEQIRSSSLSVIVNEEEEYEINDILDSRYHYDKLQYKVAWTDHFLNRAWYSAKNLQNHSKEILNDYHQRYSEKFDSTLRLIVIIEASYHSESEINIKRQNSWFKMFSTEWKRRWKNMIENDVVKILSKRILSQRLLILLIDIKKRKYV
jgi:hypothetical protein